MTSIGPSQMHVACPQMADTAQGGGWPRPQNADAHGRLASFSQFLASSDVQTPALAQTSPSEAGERFISSNMGGVIVGADGAPAGRVPAGSFLDTTTGNVYGADGAAINVPVGATVDFFDLPDISTLVSGPSGSPSGGGGTLVAGDGGSMPPMKSISDDSAPMKTAVAGASGGGDAAPVKGGGPIQKGMSADAPMKMRGHMHGHSHAAQRSMTSGGGPIASSVAGASGIGTTPTLESSLAELINTLRELTMAMAAMQTSGGGGTLVSASTPTQVAPAPTQAEVPTAPPVTETAVAGASSTPDTESTTPAPVPPASATASESESVAATSTDEGTSTPL